jgi:predicted nucleic-acid-binding protein
MSKKVKLLDTNVVIRFLTADDPNQSPKAKTLFEQATPRSILISDVIMVEIVHVLLSVYGLDRAEVVAKINLLLEFPALLTSKSLWKRCLSLYQSEPKLSFVDAYLIASCQNSSLATVYSFDKKVTTILGEKAAAF